MIKTERWVSLVLVILVAALFIALAGYAESHLVTIR